MKFIADFHIHSHFSLATSKELTPEHLDYWARIKGISLVATGDFTHPRWVEELKEKLVPAGNGLFKLRPALRLKLPFGNAEVENREVYFILSAEISNIYKKKGKVRKVHNLLYAPDFETVEKMQQELGKIGNITSDGRPILGLDSRNLLELSLSVSQDIFFVPAHIWTPWFSVLGEKSGFDSVEDCFEDLTDHVYAVETGLSTDPALNWMCSFLDRFTLLSNSDAHSPDRLGRNANRFDCGMDYASVMNAIKQGDGKTFLGTIDMYPQEGKYHYDGHRKCEVCWNPVETLRNHAKCPVCGKRVVVGVASRIAEISDRTDITKRTRLCGFHSIIPLPEILSEIYGAGESSKKVKQAYFGLIQKLGSEFDILLHHDVATIEKAGGPVLAEAITRMRDGRILIREGFDGEYGIIKVFRPGETVLYESGEKLFSPIVPAGEEVPKRKLLNFDLQEYRDLREQHFTLDTAEDTDEQTDWLSSFNPEQRTAVMHHTGPALVLAGPGTGKTRVLTSRIACLVNQHAADPSSILALTFTNKAAGEIRERLEKSIVPEILDKISVNTFHALGLRIISENLELTGRQNNFLLTGDEEKMILIRQITGFKEQECRKLAAQITLAKQNLRQEDDMDPDFRLLFFKYQDLMKTNNAFDLEDLIYIPWMIMNQHPGVKEKYLNTFRWILIDEYQDINHSQYHMVRMLLNKECNLFAIGDPNQSIYGFRGSDIEFIRRFRQDYKNAMVYQLKKSYRCTDRILKASTSVLSREEEALKGTSKGIKLHIDSFPGDRAEAEFIARTIDELMGGMQFHSMDRGVNSGEESLSLSDFAVLCRTRSQMPIIESVFLEKNIPYQVISRESSFSMDPLKTVLDILSAAVENNPLSLALLEKKSILPQTWEDLNLSDTVNNVLSHIINKFPELHEEKHVLAVQRLTAISEKFGSNFSEFLHHIRLGAGVDTWEAKAERVTVMTIHASKGLEFECVFIPGCEDGIIPYSLNFGETDPEEEKRLLYVAMTRASQHLYISHALRRRIFNREYQLPGSPFLNAIEQNLFEASFREKKKGKDDAQLKLF